jgi:hypothetical protein
MISRAGWSVEENDAVAMLIDDLTGRHVNKAAQHRAIREQTGRSSGWVEFKLCNISTAAKAFGLPLVRGCQPCFNFQMALAEVISRWLARHPNWNAPTRPVDRREMAESATLFVGPAPVRSSHIPIAAPCRIGRGPVIVCLCADVS